MHSLWLGSTSDKTHLSRHLKLPDSIKYTLNFIWVIQQHRIYRWYTPFRYRGITLPFPRPCVVARQHLSTYIIHIFISHFILATSYSSSDWFRNPDTEQNLVKLACLNVCRSRLELQRDPQFDIPMKINQRITNKIDKQKRFNGKQTILFSSQGFFCSDSGLSWMVTTAACVVIAYFGLVWFWNGGPELWNDGMCLVVTTNDWFGLFALLL